MCSGLGGLVGGSKDNWSPGNLEGDFYSIVAYSRGKAMWVTAT